MGAGTFAVAGTYVLDEETTVNESVAITWTTEGVTVEAPADKDAYTIMTLADLMGSMGGEAAPDEELDLEGEMVA